MKSKETYEKVAETFTKKGDTAWSRAKSGDGDHYYGIAKGYYETAKTAREKADSMKGEK